MTIPTRNIIPTPNAKTLTALRSLAATPVDSMADALAATERQARLLRDLLPGDADIAEHLTGLIPRIRIDYVDNIPVAGISFWGQQQWNIHVRKGDPVEVQEFTILHELKHILDHPLRREHPNLVSDADWETLANHFASCITTSITKFAAR
jgi:hypothetical protein